MKVAIAGAGYVGISLGVMLAQYHDVQLYDVNEKRVEQLNNKCSPIVDVDVQFFLREKVLNLKASCDYVEAFSDADYIFVATPTDYDEEIGWFDTSSLEDVVEKALKVNSEGLVVIKSTVPIGFTRKLRERFSTDRILFSPEFLREGFALRDQLHPYRIIVGEKSERAKRLGEFIRSATEEKNAPIFLTGSDEAEAIKLFSNAFLAMRVAFFNELDAFAELSNLSSREIIEGICLDPRIGNFYNNPSFGFGGYCLPKDTKQLRAHLSQLRVPGELINAVIKSNESRVNFIVEKVVKSGAKVVGIYRLTSKYRGDNFRQSVLLEIAKRLEQLKLKVIVYEPLIKESDVAKFGFNFDLISDLGDFKSKSELILANRVTEELVDVIHKVYSRDIYHRD